MCKRAHKSPSMAAVIIFLETTETVCCTGSLNLGQQQFTEILCLGAASRGSLPSIVSVLTFPSIPPPVHRTLEDGAGVGVWRLFAGTV